jgi:predicted HicB family RNase H-like nuclease
MSNALTYKGYTARAEFDARDNIFVGRILGIPESITFHGETVAQLTRDFRVAVNHYLADCAQAGKEPHKSYSGKLMLRIPPDIHARAAMMAEAHGKSINQWVAELLAHAK